jgi:hypothetical protein
MRLFATWCLVIAGAELVAVAAITLGLLTH